jgi:site-specific recombinase XerC
MFGKAIGTRTEGPVFLSPSVRPWKVANLRRTYSRLENIAGLTRDLVLHLARHECGTTICRERGIEFARRLLGHSNISTTQRYMHLDDPGFADAQDLVESRAGRESYLPSQNRRASNRFLVLVVGTFTTTHTVRQWGILVNA